MNDLTNHGVPRAFQLLWRRRPRVAAASWCKRRYGREREWRSRVGLTECGSGKTTCGFAVDTLPYLAPSALIFPPASTSVGIATKYLEGSTHYFSISKPGRFILYVGS